MTNNLDVDPLLLNLHWFQVSFSMKNTRLVKVQTEPLVAILNAIILHVNGHANIDSGKVWFQLNYSGCSRKSRDFSRKVEAGETLALKVFLACPDYNPVINWCRALKEYLQNPPNGQSNFDLLDEPEIEPRNLESILMTPGFPPIHRLFEICLEFHTPFKPRGYTNFAKKADILPQGAILLSIADRIHKVFGLDLRYEANPELEEISYALQQIKGPPHLSKSGRKVSGNSHSKPKDKNPVQHLSGYTGKVFIRGVNGTALALLVLGTELHAGRDTRNSMGHYTLKKSPGTLYSDHWTDREKVFLAIHDVLENTDPIDGEYYEAGNLYEELMRRLEKGYTPEPAIVWMIPRPGKEPRRIEHLRVVDGVIHRLLLRTLDRLDLIPPAECIGIRKGYSTVQTSNRICDLIAEGFTTVFQGDIRQFYEQVDLPILEGILTRLFPVADSSVLKVLLSCLHTPYMENGKVHARTTGLITGSPLSPLMANLYLYELDKSMQDFKGIRFFRYADDFLLLARDEAEIGPAKQKIETVLQTLHLELNPEKSRQVHAAQGFVFLGTQYRQTDWNQANDPDTRFLRKPFNVTEPYVFVSFSNGCIEVRKKNEVMDAIPIERVGEVILHYPAGISSALVQHCLKAGIPITLTYQEGTYMTALNPGKKSYYDLLTLHGMKYARLTEKDILHIAAQIASEKIHNHIPLFSLMRLEKKKKPRLIQELEEKAAHMYRARSLDELRGMEGSAARFIYATWGEQILETDFIWKGRERLNPDPLNSLINLTSYLMFNRINTTLRTLGINPFLGFLHSPQNRYESLVCDIQELFRGRMLRFIRRLIHLGTIQLADFEQTERGCWLNKKAKHKLIEAFEKEMNRKSGKGFTLRDEIYRQCLNVRDWSRSDIPLHLYRWRV